MWVLLSLVIFLGSFLRFGFLDKVPPELFGDEVDVGYQAASLLHTGRDLYGQVMPTYIHSLSEWRAPLLMYATVPTIAIWGNSQTAVRLPQVIFGTLAPLLVFILAYQTTKSKSISLLSALSLALMPWHIHYSRVAFEVVLMLDLIMLGTLLFLKQRFELCVLSFALSMYTYSTAVVFTPLWVIILMIFNRRFPPWRSGVLFVMLLVPFILNLTTGHAQDRFNSLSAFNNPVLIKTINLLRNQDPSYQGYLWHNKVETYFSILLGNYLRAFSSEFLFIRGDPTYRHSIQIIGQLLPITAPFVFLGLWSLVKRRQWLWLIWLALAPLPATFTVDGGFHATRLFLMIPSVSVATGIGVLQFFQILAPRFRLMVSGLLSLGFILYFSLIAHYYIVHYAKDSWRWWHVGYQSALTELARIAPNYQRVFINNTYEPSLVRFLFWTNYPPAKFQQQFTLDQPVDDIVANYNGFSLDDKYFFGQFSSPAQKIGIANYLLPDSLYLISQRDDVAGDWDWRKNPPDNVVVLFTSTNAYDSPILYLITKK